MCLTVYHKVPNRLWLLYIIYNIVHTIHILCVFDILPQGAYYIQYCLNNILIELKHNCDRDVAERDVAKAQS